MINRNTEISENGITEILENIEPDTLETEISEISENETTRLQENIDPVYAHNVREVNQHIRLIQRGDSPGRILLRTHHLLNV